MKKNLYNNLTKIKNNYFSKKRSVTSRISKKEFDLLIFLKDNGFINSFSIKKKAKIFLKFDKFSNPALNSFQFVPKNWEINTKKKEENTNTIFMKKINTLTKKSKFLVNMK